jgi:NCS1 family nucleobase:cation symporter-1
MTDVGASEAADRGYRDSVAKVEPYGVEHIPDVERHGKPISQFYVWFAAGLNFPIMVLGFSAAWFGLSLTAAVTAVIAGAAVGSLLMGVLSRMGVHLGVPQQMQARGPLGFVGNLLPVAYINVFAGVGWAALTVILGGKALGELTGIPFLVSAIGLVALQLVVAVFGYNMIHFLQKVLSFVLVVLFALMTVVAVTRGSAPLEANSEAGGYIGATGGWITLAGWFLAFLVAWTPFASDYSRYLPDDREVSRRAGWLTGLGNFITLSWLGVAGAVVAGGATSADPITALRDLTGPWAVPCLLAILLSSFSQNFLNVYGGAISLQTLGLPVSRTQAVVLICVAAFGVSLWAESGVYDKFTVFLNLTAYFIAPYVAVILLDYAVGGRRDKQRIAELFDKRRVLEWGFVAWLAGVLGSVPFWQSTIFTGPLADVVDGGDVSMYVGFAIASVVFLATFRLRPLWHLTGEGRVVEPAESPVVVGAP